jgi:hypothetical protein
MSKYTTFSSRLSGAYSDGQTDASRGRQLACTRQVQRPDLDIPVTFTINIDASGTPVPDTGFIKPLRCKPQPVLANGQVAIVITFAFGKYNVPGMARACAGLALCRNYSLGNLGVTWNPRSATQSGIMYFIPGSPQEARIPRDIDVYIGAPNAQSCPACKPFTIDVGDTNYNAATRALGDTVGHLVSPFFQDPALFQTQAGTDSQAFFSLAVIGMDILPAVPQPNPWVAGAIRITARLQGFDTTADAAVFDRLSPAVWFGTGDDTGRQGNEVLMSTMRSIETGQPLQGHGGMKVVSKAPFVHLGAKGLTTVVRGFQFTDVAAAFGVLGSDFLDALMAQAGRPVRPDNVLFGYLKFCAADARSLNWLDPIPAADYTLQTAILLGSDEKPVATNGLLLQTARTWEQLKFTPPSSGHAKGATATLVPQGVRKNPVWAWNGHLFVQMVAADPSGAQQTYACGVSPYSGAMAGAGLVAADSDQGLGAYPRYATTFVFRDILPAPMRVGGLLDRFGQILGTVGTVVNQVIPIAGAIFNVLAAPSTTPAQKRRTPRRADTGPGDQVQTFSSAFVPQGVLDVLTVGSPAGFNQDIPRMYSSRWTEHKDLKYIFDTIYAPNGNITAKSALNVLSFNADLFVRLFFAEKDAGWQVGPVGEGLGHAPGGQAVYLEVPITGASIDYTIMIEIQLVHGLERLGNPGAPVLKTPVNDMGKHVFQCNGQAEYVQVAGTNLNIELADGSRIAAGGYAVVDARVPIALQVTIPPPAGYVDDDGVFRAYLPDDLVAWGVVMEYHFLATPVYTVPAVVGVTMDDQAFWHPADLLALFTLPAGLNTTGQFGIGRCSNPGSATSAQYVEVQVERTVQVDGTVTGTVDPNWATLVVSNFSIGAGAVDRTQPAVPTE